MAASRQKGRNKKFCEMYKKTGRRMINKKKKLVRHMKRFPNDKQALKVLEKL